MYNKTQHRVAFLKLNGRLILLNECCSEVGMQIHEDNTLWGRFLLSSEQSHDSASVFSLPLGFSAEDLFPSPPLA